MRADEQTLSALARLTANEKACLRRRLLPQTAKEMAIDLGISPHAVEKRLKMARTKLGVSSSLVAARMLADAERYQTLVPQGSDLSVRSGGSQDDAVAAPNRLRHPLAEGLIMIATISLFVLLAQDVPLPPRDTSSAPPLMQDSKPIATRKVGMDEATAFLDEAFQNLDLDHSGSLDSRETATLEPRDANRDATLPPAPPAGAPDPAAERKWMGKLDTNRDGRVSAEEYIGYMMPWTLWQGVPAFWHAKPRP